LVLPPTTHALQMSILPSALCHFLLSFFVHFLSFSAKKAKKNSANTRFIACIRTKLYHLSKKY
ncbi:MAG: hypothetical protein ACLUGF_11175, partial [Clostridium sp.]